MPLFNLNEYSYDPDTIALIRHAQHRPPWQKYFIKKTWGVCKHILAIPASVIQQTVMMGIIAFLLLIAAGLLFNLSALLVNAFIVVMATNTILLALMQVRRLPAGQSLTTLLLACAMLTLFAISVMLGSRSIPAWLGFAAGYGMALSMSISVYTLPRLVRINLVPRLA